ncbi:transporter substrate-binding domain-containing protein [Aerococcaceae bacterium DSM 111021]|nr:transporter substrate-binding domain-containing protein [Aerococcaceae bacterium DSM 111021]
MKKMVKVFLTFVMVLSLFASMSPVQAQKTLADIQESGELVMGTSADFPPFEWVILDGGEAQIVGIDADLAQLIADEIGVELVIEDTSFDGLIPSVSSGRVDVVLAGVTYSEERAEQVDFSEVYYETNSKFVVPIGQEGDFESLEDFANLKIGVQKGTIQENLLKELLPDAELVSMNKNGDLIEAIKAKRVDAVLMDGIVVEEFVNLNSDAIVLMEDIQVEEESEGFAIVTAKDNTELMEVINKVIADVKESGQMEEIVTKNTELNAESSEAAAE